MRLEPLADFWECSDSRRESVHGVRTIRLFKRIRATIGNDGAALVRRAVRRPQALLVPIRELTFSAEPLSDTVFALHRDSESMGRELLRDLDPSESIRVSWAVLGLVVIGDAQLVLRSQSAARRNELRYVPPGGALVIRAARQRWFPAGALPEAGIAGDEFRFTTTVAAYSDFEQRYHENVDGFREAVDAEAETNLLRELYEELVLEPESAILGPDDAHTVLSRD